MTRKFDEKLDYIIKKKLHNILTHKLDSLKKWGKYFNNDISLESQ